MRTRIASFAALSAPLWFVLAACTVNPVPVHPVRVKVAQDASRPIQRGPGAPGYLKLVWSFSSPEGYLFDSGKVEVAQDLARLKERKSGVFKYSVERATIETSSGKPYAELDSFSETLGPGTRGSTKYQLSNDGKKWYFHDGSKWVPAELDPGQANTASVINAHIQAFHVEAGAGALHFRAFLISPNGREPVELKRVEAGSISPQMDVEH